MATDDFAGCAQICCDLLMRLPNFVPAVSGASEIAAKAFAQRYCLHLLKGRDQIKYPPGLRTESPIPERPLPLVQIPDQHARD